MATKKNKIVLDVENPEAVAAAVKEALNQQEKEVVPAVTVVMDIVPEVTVEPKAEKKDRKGTRKNKAEEAAKAALAAANQAAVDAAFAVAKKADPAVTAVLLVKESKLEPAPVKPVVPEMDMAELNAILFGENAPFYEQMLSLRAQAAAKFEEGKKADLGKKRYEARKEADRLAYAIPNQMGRELFNLLRSRGDAAQQAQFSKLETAYRDGTDEKLAKQFEMLLNARIKAMGHADEHLQNLAKAAQTMKDFEAYEFEVNQLFEDGRKLYAEANDVAMLFGWPVTKQKESKGGEA